MMVKFIFIFLCSSVFLSCRHAPGIKFRTYEVYANDDIAFSTENGELVFIPFDALLRDGANYHGKVTIKLAVYPHLLDSLSAFSNRGKYMHPLQLSSPVIDCMDEEGRSLKLNSGEGYQLFVLMPLVPATAAQYEDSLIYHANDVFLSQSAFDSFSVSGNLKFLPRTASVKDLLALSRRSPSHGRKDVRKDASLAYRKLQSAKAFRHLLEMYMHNAAGEFIRSTPEQNQVSDKPKKIPFIGFNILELYNKTGSTNLLNIFRENAVNWQNSLLIIDWTGSMQIHRDDIYALLQDLYLKGTIRHIAFYNDKHDPGPPRIYDETGFFWIDSVKSFEEVKELMLESEMDYGGGEHLEESDYSALIRATSQKSPPWKSDYNQIIMLVDNNAPPRDSVIFEQIAITKKIFVIAYDSETPCDVFPQYHNLVKKFGGLLISEKMGKSHNCRDTLQEKCVPVQ